MIWSISVCKITNSILADAGNRAQAQHSVIANEAIYGATIESRSATIEILASGLALFSNHPGAGTAPPIGKLSLEISL